MSDFKMPDFSSLITSSSFAVTPSIAIPKMPEPIIPAKWMYERLVRSIAEFEEGLDESEEIGARLVSFGNDVFHIEDLGYWGPDIIKFYGTNQNGKPIELIQHISQLSVLLVAMPKIAEKPRRIGFKLTKELEENTNK